MKAPIEIILRITLNCAVFLSRFKARIKGMTLKCLDLQRNNPTRLWCSELEKKGERLSLALESTIKRYQLSDVLTLSGHPSRRFLNWGATEHYTVEQIKTFFMQEIFSEDVLVLSTLNMSISHTDATIDSLSTRFDRVLAKLSNTILNQTLHLELKVTPLQPLFKVR